LLQKSAIDASASLASAISTAATRIVATEIARAEIVFPKVVVVGFFDKGIRERRRWLTKNFCLSSSFFALRFHCRWRLRGSLGLFRNPSLLRSRSLLRGLISREGLDHRRGFNRALLGLLLLGLHIGRKHRGRNQDRNTTTQSKDHRVAIHRKRPPPYDLRIEKSSQTASR